MFFDKLLNSFWIRFIFICMCTVFTVYSTTSFATANNGVQSGSINISGEVYHESCVVNAGAGAGDISLTLEKTHLTKLRDSTSPVGRTQLKISLSDCPDINGIVFSLEADPASIYNGDHGVLTNAATVNAAKDIGIKITDPNYTGINFNNYNKDLKDFLQNGTNKELTLYAQYHALSRTAEAGKVESNFTYKITYP
ncbi:fimbrial protein [Aeromonas hydrophila]|uniref:fimbrial protein n=1 Tax=Aeromonas hydrophila TaxID=644 RepID=UPI001376BAF0|nr:fimbrial protein [Aeromonas hydrophila]